MKKHLSLLIAFVLLFLQVASAAASEPTATPTPTATPKLASTENAAHHAAIAAMDAFKLAATPTTTPEPTPTPTPIPKSTATPTLSPEERYADITYLGYFTIYRSWEGIENDVPRLLSVNIEDGIAIFEFSRPFPEGSNVRFSYRDNDKHLQTQNVKLNSDSRRVRIQLGTDIDQNELMDIDINIYKKHNSSQDLADVQTSAGTSSVYNVQVQYTKKATAAAFVTKVDISTVGPFKPIDSVTIGHINITIDSGSVSRSVQLEKHRGISSLLPDAYIYVSSSGQVQKVQPDPYTGGKILQLPNDDLSQYQRFANDHMPKWPDGRRLLPAYGAGSAQDFLAGFLGFSKPTPSSKSTATPKPTAETTPTPTATPKPTAQPSPMPMAQRTDEIYLASYPVYRSWDDIENDVPKIISVSFESGKNAKAIVEFDKAFPEGSHVFFNYYYSNNHSEAVNLDLKRPTSTIEIPFYTDINQQKSQDIIITYTERQRCIAAVETSDGRADIKQMKVTYSKEAQETTLGSKARFVQIRTMVNNSIDELFMHYGAPVSLQLVKYDSSGTKEASIHVYNSGSLGSVDIYHNGIKFKSLTKRKDTNLYQGYANSHMPTWPNGERLMPAYGSAWDDGPFETATPTPTATPTATPCPTETSVKGIKVGDIITFGKYDQDNKTENGMEEIEWYVIAIHDSKATLLSRYLLTEGYYHDQKANATWENSSVRAWLNDDFFSAAFSHEEQEIIKMVHLSNDASHSYKNGVSGPDTTDRVFLLSAKEVSALIKDQDILLAAYTDTAIQAMAKLDGWNFGMAKGMVDMYGGCGNWMLRSAGKLWYDHKVYGLEQVGRGLFSDKATITSGDVNQYSAHAGIRPAIVIDLNGYPVQ